MGCKMENLVTKCHPSVPGTKCHWVWDGESSTKSRLAG